MPIKVFGEMQMFVKGKVVEQSQVAPDYFLLTLEQPEIAGSAKPGQFVMLKAWDRRDLILPRPFSLYRIMPGEGRLQFMYKVRGKGTEEMTRRLPGDLVELTGPLGNGVRLPEHGGVALLGRGIGSAPLMAIAEAAKGSGLAVYAFLSARSAALILGERDFAAYSDSLALSTDDGEKGEGRLLTDMLAELIEAGAGVNQVYTCGSRRLANGLIPMQARYGLSAYVLLEEIMACGVGSCKGCVCRIRDDKSESGFVYKKVCQDGPVFPVEEVIWP